MQRILQLFSRALRLSLVVGLLCCTAATARAQGGGEPINLNATLTVTLTERPATAVLDEITRKTGIKFAYDPEDIRRLPAVSGEFKKVTVHELLDKCIAGSTFKYAIENNVVLVYDSTVKMRKFTVSGTVRDAGKTVLPGASVILKGGSGQGVSTDEKGQFTFSFSTKTSPAVLEVGFLGMETQQVIITASAKGLNVTLKEGGTRIDDVVVNGMFTRNKNTYTGSVTTSAYSAQATVRVSDVDISGEVVFDAPEWAEAFEAGADGKHEMKMPYFNSYTLVADGVELQNRDGAFGVNKDGKFFVWIRYDLPESMNSLVLVPNGSGIDYKAKIAAGETPTHENEDIVLLK